MQTTTVLSMIATMGAREDHGQLQGCDPQVQGHVAGCVE